MSERRTRQIISDVPRVDAEEEIDRPSAGGFLECFIQTFVPGIGGAPYFVFERLVDVILRVRFDNKVAGLFNMTRSDAALGRKEMYVLQIEVGCQRS